tara:strand:- start:60 stop:224 length:165 start_codon:yes stop_codon:yes gene_type:complete
MLKYIIAGLLVIILVIILLNYWPKITDKTKNKMIASIFGIISVGFVVLISLLIF